MQEDKERLVDTWASRRKEARKVSDDDKLSRQYSPVLPRKNKVMEGLVTLYLGVII